MMTAGGTEQPGMTGPRLVDAVPGLPGGGAAAAAPSEDESGAMPTMTAPRYAMIQGVAPVVLAQRDGLLMVEVHCANPARPDEPIIILMTQGDARTLGKRLRWFAELQPGEPAEIARAKAEAA